MCSMLHVCVALSMLHVYCCMFCYTCISVAIHVVLFTSLYRYRSKYHYFCGAYFYACIALCMYCVFWYILYVLCTSVSISMYELLYLYCVYPTCIALSLALRLHGGDVESCPGRGETPYGQGRACVFFTGLGPKSRPAKHRMFSAKVDSGYRIGRCIHAHLHLHRQLFPLRGIPTAPSKQTSKYSETPLR